LFAAAHPHRSCPGVSPRRIASLVRSRRSKFHIIRFRTRAKAHSFHCCSSSHKIFDFAGALNYREVVAALAESISFGGGDSIFKVHRETVPSIGSQRERHFIDPLTNQLGKVFRFVRRNFEKIFESLSTNQLGKFFGFERKTFENFSANPSTT
jgi:hypothetical protein